MAAAAAPSDCGCGDTSGRVHVAWQCGAAWQLRLQRFSVGVYYVAGVQTGPASNKMLCYRVCACARVCSACDYIYIFFYFFLSQNDLIDRTFC